MKHLGTAILETERLVLRPFAVSDAAAMYRNWASDPEVTKFLTWPVHESPEATAELLTGWVAQYKNPDYYTWAIVLKEQGDEPIGSIGTNRYDEQIGKAEMGYCMGKDWWHRGLMAEALQAVIDYLFEQVGFNRIQAIHDVNNPNSGAVMRKCGMVYEGTLRQSSRSNQGIVDTCVYAILARDYLK